MDDDLKQTVVHQITALLENDKLRQEVGVSKEKLEEALARFQGRTKEEPVDLISFTTQTEGECIRHNGGKPRLSYIPLELLYGAAGVFEDAHVSGKYPKNNWRIGQNYTNASDSLMRHLTAFLAGEDIDPDSGRHHVDHVLCCAIILKNSIDYRPDLDDRHIIDRSESK